MATGGTSFEDPEEQELHNWANGSLEDRLNNMVYLLMSCMQLKITHKNTDTLTIYIVV